MTANQTADVSERVYRVDRFIIPGPARAEFLERVGDTHDLLRTLPGFIRDFVLEQASGPGAYNIVTLVEWASADAIAHAKEAVQAMREETGFDHHEMFTRHGIEADLGNYRRVES